MKRSVFKQEVEVSRIMVDDGNCNIIVVGYYFTKCVEAYHKYKYDINIINTIQKINNTLKN